MKILLLGKNGQLGWELQRALAPLGEVTALDRHPHPDYCGDLTQLDALGASVRRLAPQLIVNAAAYTAVDLAESNRQLAYRVNAEAVAVLAREAAAIDAWLVHFSTDYVFDGSGQQPWQEDDHPAPLSVYGASKLAGEQQVRASGCKHLIFRTSWVYGRRGGNFIRTMLRLGREREQLDVVDDQIGAPTAAELIADVSAHAARSALSDRSLGGTYHLAASGETSWHAYASHVLERARRASHHLAVRSIRAVPSSSYPTAAQRPLNSRLDTQKLCSSFGLYLPDWRRGVDRLLDEILATP